MVEDDHRAGYGEARLGDVQVIRRGVRQPLQVPDGVVGEVSHRPADEGWQVRQRSHALLSHDLCETPERVTCGYLPHTVGVDYGVEPVAIRERALGVEAEKGVAAEALCGLCALQEEDVLFAGELEDGGDGRLEIPDELGVERHDVVLAGELAGLAERWRQVEPSGRDHGVLWPPSPSPSWGE